MATRTMVWLGPPIFRRNMASASKQKSKARKKPTEEVEPGNFLLGLLFKPDDVGDLFTRNVDSM